MNKRHARFRHRLSVMSGSVDRRQKVALLIARIRRATALREVTASGASATPASGSQRLLAGERWIRTVGTP
jgi:hypothetical protein